MAIKQLYSLIPFNLYNNNISHRDTAILILSNSKYISSHTAYIRRFAIDTSLLSQIVYLPLIVSWPAKIIVIVETIIFHNILILGISDISFSYLDILFK